MGSDASAFSQRLLQICESLPQQGSAKEVPRQDFERAYFDVSPEAFSWQEVLSDELLDELLPILRGHFIEVEYLTELS